jgi:hypothetical protein
VSFHDVCIKFHKDWFSHSEVNRGGFTYRSTQTVRYLISLLLFFRNNENRLKTAKMPNFEVISEKFNLDFILNVITYLQEYKTTTITTTTSTTATTATTATTTTTATEPGNQCSTKSGFTSSQMLLIF